MGFSVPLASWFRGPLREHLHQQLFSGRLMDTGLFNANYIEHLVSQHNSGVRDYSAPLWTLMMFAQFLEHAEPTGMAA